MTLSEIRRWLRYPCELPQEVPIALRALSGMTLTEATRSIGIAEGSWRRWEEGTAKVSWAHMRCFLEVHERRLARASWLTLER